MSPPPLVRWAARYAFVDEVWRGRARVIVDPALESVLRDAGPGVAHGSDPALRELVDDLIPVDPIDGEPVWMAVATADVAEDLGPTRPGTTFVPLSGIGDVLGRAHWDVALVDLSADLDPDRGNAGDQAADTLDELGLDAARGRVVVLSAPVRDFPRSDRGLEYEEMADVVAERLGGGRVYGLYVPPIAAVVEFGDAIDPTDDEQTAQIRTTVEVDDDYDDVPLTYDNTLGTQDPQLLEYIAVAGARPPVDGLALVELPGGDAEVGDDAGVRAQLVQARRQADLAAIDRQVQLERAEGLLLDNVQLRRELEAVRSPTDDSVGSGPAEAGVGAGFAAAEVALDAALAREQALKWRVTELENTLSKAMSRPVDEVEAQLAQLKEQLAATVTPRDMAVDAPAKLDGGPSNGQSASASKGMAVRGTAGTDSMPTGPTARPKPKATEGDSVGKAAVRTVEALVRRIERGGISTLELRAELVALRRRLTST